MPYRPRPSDNNIFYKIIFRGFLQGFATILLSFLGKPKNWRQLQTWCICLTLWFNFRETECATEKREDVTCYISLEDEYSRVKALNDTAVFFFYPLASAKLEGDGGTGKLKQTPPGPHPCVFALVHPSPPPPPPPSTRALSFTVIDEQTSANGQYFVWYLSALNLFRQVLLLEILANYSKFPR